MYFQWKAKTFFTGILLFLLFGGSVWANDIRMYLDAARFRYDHTNTYLEIYYMLYVLPHEKPIPSERIWLEFLLNDTQKDSLLASSRLSVVIDYPQSEEPEAAVKGSVIKTVLPPGKYLIKMYRLTTKDGERVDSVEYKFTTSPFAEDKITISDLELCSRIVKNSTNTKSIFYKNTMEVFPNPMHMYGKENPDLYYYIELYNIAADNPKDQISIEAAIVDEGGNILLQKQYMRTRENPSLVECGSFDISSLSSGLYTMVFAVTDLTANYSVYTRDNFFVMNPGQPSDVEKDLTIAFAQSMFFSMPEAEVDEKFEQIEYIAPKELKKVYESLDTVEKKRHLLFKFWYEWEREGKGLQKEYYERVQYANEHFRFANRKGWQSDRGRVYIVYGKPSRIEQFPNGPDYRPFEIWYYYELEGGSTFYFVDETGFGDYKLVTSTYRDEIYHPGWESLIQDWLRSHPSYSPDIN